MLIIYRTIPYPKTIRKYTLSLYIAEVTIHIALGQNSIRSR